MSDNIESTKMTLVGKTKNGIDVFVDLENSHASTHLRDTKGLFETLQEAITKINVVDESIKVDVDMQREVGLCDLVETNESDDIFYAKRPKREKYSRFVRNRVVESTNFITINLYRQDDGSYYIHTTYPGPRTPGFPHDKDDPSNERRDFWGRHALVVGKQKILEETIIKECPW